MYADVLDGWAFITKRRLAEALDQLGDRADVTIVWRPYVIDPTAPSPSRDLATERLEPTVEASLQQTAPGVDAAIDRLEVGQLALEIGIPAWNPQWRASSWAAHRMITSALDDHGPGRQAEVVEAIFTAHFVDGADINSLDFLRGLADRYELPPPVALTDVDAAPAYLQPGFPKDDPVERSTREAQLSGKAIGAAGSPTFVANSVIIGAGVMARDELAQMILEVVADPPSEVPDEVRRFRNARALLAAGNPLGALYLLAPLRPEYDGVRGFETLTARALAASASLEPARKKLEELIERWPDDAYLRMLLGKTLKRMQDPAADKHIALASAMNPEFLDF